MKTSALVLTLFLPILVNGVTKDNFAISNQKVSSGNDDDDFETISFTVYWSDVTPISGSILRNIYFLGSDK